MFQHSWRPSDCDANKGQKAYHSSAQTDTAAGKLESVSAGRDVTGPWTNDVIGSLGARPSDCYLYRGAAPDDSLSW